VERPLVEPVLQAGASIPQLLEQFREYEARTRYRVRRELRDRDANEVAEAIDKFWQSIDDSDPQRDRLLTECLWVLEGHHIINQALLEAVLAAETPDARAAGVHAIANQRQWIEGAVEMIAPAVDDPHPRVQLEAVRALSFFPQLRSAQLALGVMKHPMDGELQYTLESTLGALQPVWQDQQELLAAADPDVEVMLLRLTAGENIGRQATQMLERLLQETESPAGRSRWLMQLGTLDGNRRSGARVFQRACNACHKVGDEGADFGPNLSDVGKRLRREEMIESIVFPSLKIEDKYKATNIVTADGKALSGLVVEENDQQLSLVVADGKVQQIPIEDIEIRQQVDVSSMPERLHESMSGGEFADLLRYLYSQRTTPTVSIGAQ
jgi:putative heme-binding domain-containing protein